MLSLHCPLASWSSLHVIPINSVGVDVVHHPGGVGVLFSTHRQFSVGEHSGSHIWAKERLLPKNSITNNILIIFLALVLYIIILGGTK